MATASRSNVLRTAREKLGFSQAEIAKKLGITSAAVGHYESGLAKPPMARAKKIARMLKIDVEQIEVSSRGQRGSGRRQTTSVDSASGERWPNKHEVEILAAPRGLPLAKRRPAMEMLLSYADRVNGQR